MAAQKTKPQTNAKSEPRAPKAMPPKAARVVAKGAKSAEAKGETKVKSKAKSKPAPKAAAAVASKPSSKPAAVKASNGERVTEGSKAPSFSLPDDSGNVVSSASLAGKPYVLYFYPKDDTPGCTAEACDFRDNLSAFNTQKLRLLGVSPDDSTRHTKFKQKYGLTFTLLSDTDKTLATAYGVWVEKQNYGRTYMGVERSTFLIDKSGVIKKAWHRVRVPGHVAAVLASANS